MKMSIVPVYIIIILGGKRDGYNNSTVRGTVRYSLKNYGIPIVLQ